MSIFYKWKEKISKRKRPEIKIGEKYSISYNYEEMTFITLEIPEGRIQLDPVGISELTNDLLSHQYELLNIDEIIKK